MSLARCCCGGSCRSVYNCIQANAVTPGVQSFTTTAGGVERFQDSSGNYWRVGGLSLNTGGVTVTENSVQVSSSGTCCLAITYNVSVTLPYTANLTRFGALFTECRCLENGVQTDLPSFTGVMSWQGDIEYVCGPGPGGVGVSETVGWTNQTAPIYDALPDFANCVPPKVTVLPTAFDLALKDLPETGPGFVAATGCTGLTSAYFDFPLKINAPFCNGNTSSASRCACASANSLNDAEINIRLGFS